MCMRACPAHVQHMQLSHAIIMYHHTRHRHPQVCAGIVPFNFPFMVPAWMFPVAIAAGNTFVLKPSEKVPGAAMMLAELALQAGVPKYEKQGERVDT